MGKNNNQKNSSRRQFFTAFFSDDTQKVKMLTPDGRLVTIDKSVYDRAAGKQKATNKDIYQWMDNPSKKTDQ